MRSSRKAATKLYGHFMHDSLYRNSLFLMASMVITALTSFIFLIIIAHLYSTADVGKATATISVVGLLASLSILGLNNAVIRFAKSLKKLDSYINTVLVITSIAALLISSGFLLNSFWLSKKLAFISHDTSLIALFVLLTLLVTINTFTDSVFVAKRIAVFIFVENIFLGITKIVTPYIFDHFNYAGIIMAYGSGIVASLIVTAEGFRRFGYKFRDKPDTQLLSGTKGYAFGNYISGIASSGAPMVVPAITLNALGAKASAYFYVALMVATILLVIPQAINRSLFAEGSHDESAMKKHLAKSSKLIAVLLSVAFLGIVVLGKPFLHFFKPEYAQNAFEPMLILSFSALFACVTSTVGTMLNITRQIKAMTTMNVLGFIAIVAGSAIGATHNLVTLSFGWLVGQIVSAIIAAIFYKRFLHQELVTEAT